MTDTKPTYPGEQIAGQNLKTRYIDRLARKAVKRKLATLHHGRLVIVDPEGQHTFGASSDTLSATITVNDMRLYSYIAFGGVIGVAEAYMQGYWSCDDLTHVIRIFLRNREALEGMETGSARLFNPLRRLLHTINRNTRSGSRRNIAAHYDLGNEFFGLWLDETMMYSSAVFQESDMSLHEASVAKLDRICQKLELSNGDHVLEIGTGWGGFAIHAARHYGCRVTTTTISSEQYDFARRRVSEAGLDDRITLLLKDYRELDGEFDKLVSIEMIEAVGPQFMKTYFERCARHLKPDGMMLLQAITIADQRYSKALKSVDFIQRYIFPGGFLPSVTAMLESITASSDLRIYHLEDIGEHYAKTLNAWRRNFNRQLHRIRTMGYTESFLRMWHYYYCYCEGAFTERAIGNVQMLLIKPACRRTPIVPQLVPAEIAADPTTR